MIQRKEAEMQVVRLSALGGGDQFFGAAGEFIETELTEALQQFSTNREHASRIVSAWLSRKPRYIPTVEHIRQLAVECDRDDDPREWQCSHCRDTGFSPTYQLITWETPTRNQIQTISREQYQQLKPVVTGAIGEQCVVEGVQRCMYCYLGRRRAEEEQRDKAEAAAKAMPVGSGR